MSDLLPWDDVFMTGKLPSTWTPAELTCKALNAWAMCHLGQRPPEEFGRGMAAIGVALRISPTPDNLMKFSERFLSTNPDLSAFKPSQN